MQFDRAMALLLAGQEVQRAVWIRPEKNTHLALINDGENYHVVAQGVETVFGREIPFTKDAGISGRDMAADDWIIVGSNPPPAPTTGGGSSSPSSSSPTESNG